MAKVIRSFSLDPEVSQILEDYCSASDNWNRNISRSRIVNDAINWYLAGDTAELVASQEALMQKVRELAMIRDSPETPRRSWWRRLLLRR